MGGGPCGYCLKGRFYVDTRLPFGLSSSAAIHGRFSWGFKWILADLSAITNSIQYADDHLLLSSQGDYASYGNMVRVAKMLVVELSSSKYVPPVWR